MSNTLRAGTGGALNSAYWSASTFGADQFAQASLPNSSGTQYGPGIAVRLSGTKGYFLWYGNSPGTVSLWRMDGSSSSSWTQLAQSAPRTMSPSSDVWMIQAVGSTISGYQNGNLVVQATDTKITSGSPGVWLYYSSNQIDNWSGGDVTTHQVGGTVSGLSGTVVLQDNGGDDLSVSASGAFTFATALAAGSAYNVTVKTEPGRPDLLGSQRIRHRRVVGHHQHRRHLRRGGHPSGRRHGLGPVRHGGAAGQRRR